MWTEMNVLTYLITFPYFDTLCTYVSCFTSPVEIVFLTSRQSPTSDYSANQTVLIWICNTMLNPLPATKLSTWTQPPRLLSPSWEHPDRETAVLQRQIRVLKVWYTFLAIDCDAVLWEKQSKPMQYKGEFKASSPVFHLIRNQTAN